MLRVVEKENVTALPVGNLREIVSAAQGFADAVAEGGIALRSAIIVTVDREGLLDIACLGEQPLSSEAVGMLELAKAKIVAGTFR